MRVSAVIAAILLIGATASASAQTQSKYIPELAGTYLPADPPFANAGGKQVGFTFETFSGLVVSVRYELQGTLTLPKYRDLAGNSYAVALNHNGAVRDNDLVVPTIGFPGGFGWGNDIGTTPYSRDFTEFQITLATKSDNSFYFSFIRNNPNPINAGPSLGGSTHSVFYLPSKQSLEFVPGLSSVWQELVLDSPGLVTVSSMRLSVSNDTLLSADPFGLQPIAAVPELETYALMISGLLLIGLIARAKRPQKVST